MSIERLRVVRIGIKINFGIPKDLKLAATRKLYRIAQGELTLDSLTHEDIDKTSIIKNRP